MSQLKTAYTGDSGSIHWRSDVYWNAGVFETRNWRKMGKSKSLIATLESFADTVGTKWLRESPSALEGGQASIELKGNDNSKVYTYKAQGDGAKLPDQVSGSNPESFFLVAAIATGGTSAPKASPNSNNVDISDDVFDNTTPGTLDLHTSGNYIMTEQRLEFSSAF